MATSQSSGHEGCLASSVSETQATMRQAESLVLRQSGHAQPVGLQNSFASDNLGSRSIGEEEISPEHQSDTISSINRLEKGSSHDLALDSNLVTWEGPQDPENPKNWSLGKKWAATAILSSFTFISPVASSMVAPSLHIMAAGFGVTSQLQSQMMLSIFVLGYVVGPLLLGPLSELYGRVYVLQISNVFFFCWTLGCGFAQNFAQMLIFRFLSGVGGSAPFSIGAGVLADCFTAEDRGKGIAIYSLGPLLGPSIGPIAGGFITENTTWRWCFWATSAICMVVQLCGLVFHKETYEPVILSAKAAKLRKETGNECLYTKYDSQRRITEKLSTAFKRPLRLIATQLLIQVLAVYFAFLYGTIYLVLSTFATLWTRYYHQPVGIGSLNYIALGLGFIVSAQKYGFVSDRIYRNLKSKNNNVGRPEFRAPLLGVGSFLVPVGLLWYGWSAQARTHWIMPDIGAFIFAAGANIGFQGLQAYIIESYQLYAASAIAAVTVLRSLAGFGFPLFAPYMYNNLGNGWGNSVLALIAVVFGFPAPLLMWTYGAKLRAASTFAAG